MFSARSGSGAGGGRRIAAALGRGLGVALAVTAAIGGDGCAASEPKVGIGATCSSDDDCQASLCSRGVCAKGCTTDLDCPAGSTCANNVCSVPLSVAALLLDSQTDVEGWTYLNVASMKAARDELRYADISFYDGIFGGRGEIGPLIDRLASEGTNVVIGTSGDEGPELIEAAKRHPEIQFMATSIITTPEQRGQNLSTYNVVNDQAWYVAGRVAATKAKRRLGFLAPVIQPLIVRSINAFALGARSINPDIVVEPKWIGVWTDYNADPEFEYGGQKVYREELLTQQLIDGGAEVVASWANNGRHTRWIENHAPPGQAPAVYSFNSNARDSWRNLSTGEPLKTCLGSVYNDLSHFYTDFLDKVHRRQWQASENIRYLESTEGTLVGIALNSALGLDETALRKSIAQLATPEGRAVPWSGPFETTGQLDLDADGAYDAAQAVAAGQTLTESQLNTGCYFVKGVVDKVDSEDPTSADRDALVPDGIAPMPPGVMSYGDAPTHCIENVQNSGGG